MNYDNDVSVKQWLLTFLILCIPFVNIVMMFVWAFGSGNIAPSKKNYFRAALIWALIVIVVYIIFFAIYGPALFNNVPSLSRNY